MDARIFAESLIDLVLLVGLLKMMWSLPTQFPIHLRPLVADANIRPLARLRVISIVIEMEKTPERCNLPIEHNLQAGHPT
jgi:hypothetical protein